MKKFIFTLLLLSFSLSSVVYAQINSVASLKYFMKDGQGKGYFPKTILLNTFGRQNKLTEVDLDFRTLIHWDMNAKCPSNEDEIILAPGSQNHSIVCDAGDTAAILGSGDNWIDDATGNDIYYPGKGNDTVDVGSGNDILIFESNWGKDKMTLRSHEVKTDSILGYDGSYPWKYSAFIIFGKEIKREDIVWLENRLYHLKTGDSIELNTKKVNVLFASDPENNLDPVPTQETIALEDLKSESILVEDNYLYLAKGNEGLYIVDVKNISNPVVVSKLVLPGRARSVAVENGIAYVAQADYYLQGKKGWVSIVDVKDKAAPKLLKTLKFGTSIHSIAVHSGVLYIPSTYSLKEGQRAFLIYDVSKPAEPLLISATKQKSFMGQMVYLDQKLYFSEDSRRLKMYDVSNPKVPKTVTNTPLYNQKVNSISVKDDLLVYTHKDHGMSVYRLQKDHTLKQICELKTVKKSKLHEFFHRNTLVIEDDLIYRAEGPKGVSVSSIEQCKLLNVLPSQTKPWTIALVKLDNKLVSFTTLNTGKVYELKKDMIHTKEKISFHTKKTSSSVASSKLSRDQLQTLLYKAAITNNPKEVKRLCKLGANPNVSGHERYTPVEIASRTGKIFALKALLDCEGKATKKSLFLAALTEKNEVIKILEKHGLPVTLRDKDGCSTLHFIAQDGSLDMVKYLISKGVPYDATCRKGETPLVWANHGNNCKVIDYLETLYPASHKKSDNKHCREQKIKKLQAIEAKIKQLEARKKYEALREENIRKGIYSPEEQALMNLKMKVKQKGNTLNMKFLVGYPMVTEWMAERKKISIRFLKHVTVFMGKRLLFDATLSANLSKNPIFKVKVKNSVIDEPFTLTAVNNIGYQKSLTLQPKEVLNLPTETLIPSKENQVRDFRQLFPEAWSAKSVDKAVKALYGEVQYHEGDIKVTLPTVAANSGSIPMTIKSDIDIESVAILSNTTENPLIVVFNVPKGLKVDYSLKFKSKKYDDEYVLIIGKGRDGKFYKTIKRFEIAHGGDNCS